VLATAATAASTPAHHTYKPTGLGIEFQLPSEWAAGRGRGREWKFLAFSPGHIAQLEIAAGPTAISQEAFAIALINGERAAVFKGDPRASFTQRTIKLAQNATAVEIVAVYRGISDWGPQGPNERLVVVLYGFVHGGKGYIFHFQTTDTWLPKLRSEFRHAATSVRFPHTA
jgi:hypothetical protein